MIVLYKGQSVQLELNLYNNSYAGAPVARILYKKPSGVKGHWAATISGQKMVYTTSNSDLDEAGEWQLQPYVQTADGLDHYGEHIIKQTVKNALNV